MYHSKVPELTLRSLSNGQKKLSISTSPLHLHLHLHLYPLQRSTIYVLFEGALSISPLKEPCIIGLIRAPDETGGARSLAPARELGAGRRGHEEASLLWARRRKLCRIVKRIDINIDIKIDVGICNIYRCIDR